MLQAVQDSLFALELGGDCFTLKDASFRPNPETSQDEMPARVGCEGLASNGIPRVNKSHDASMGMVIFIYLH